MLTLSLLRHAKSSWEDASLEDFERPLAKRGESAAPRMGAFMAQQGLAPELILCSPAVRARQTLDLVLGEIADNPTVAYEDGFYLASPTVLLARLRKVQGKVAHVMIVGHDPGIQMLALDLVGEGDPQLMKAMAAKFPTGGLAVIVFDLRSWSKVVRGAGRLQLFKTPKTLA